MDGTGFGLGMDWPETVSRMQPANSPYTGRTMGRRGYEMVPWSPRGEASPYTGFTDLHQFAPTWGPNTHVPDLYQFGGEATGPGSSNDAAAPGGIGSAGEGFHKGGVVRQGGKPSRLKPGGDEDRDGRKNVRITAEEGEVVLSAETAARLRKEIAPRRLGRSVA